MINASALPPTAINAAAAMRLMVRRTLMPAVRCKHKANFAPA